LAFLIASVYDNPVTGHVLSSVVWWASLIGGISGLINVWLCAKESIWNYPIGFVNVTAWFYLFRADHLFADAWLQVFFGILMAWGWIVWLTKRENKPVRPTTHIKAAEIIVGFAFIVGGTLGWARYLTHVHDIAPYPDAFIASASIFAQYLLSRKVFENWYVWIVVDLVSIALYFVKGLAPTAIVYIVFLVICLGGFRSWRQNMQVQPHEQPNAEGPSLVI
jgi:nicotinamide mononucleotide transporter